MSIIDFYIDPNKICVFSNTNCSFCSKAKYLLNDFSQSYKVIELDTTPNGPFIASELLRRTNQRTVPNIFLYGRHIGGYSELKTLYDSGDLNKIINRNLTQYQCEFCGKTSNTKEVMCRCFPRQFSDWGEPT